MIDESGTRPKLLLVTAVAIAFTVLIVMLLQQQQRAPSWSGRIQADDASGSAAISIGRFGSEEECRLAGTVRLQERGWSRGRTICGNDQLPPPPPLGDERIFELRDGAMTEVPKAKP
jgi:hypothetical protein